MNYQEYIDRKIKMQNSILEIVENSKVIDYNFDE